MKNMGGKTALGLDLNIGALLCYINICLPIGLVYSIIVVTQDKSNKLPRFHAFQVLILAVAGMVLSIPLALVLGISMFVLGAVSWTLSMIVSGLVGLVFAGIGLALLYFVVMSAIKAYGGEVYKIPFVGDYAEKYSN